MDEKYNLFKLGRILSNRESTLEWVRTVGLIPKERYCAKHKKAMILYEDRLVCGEFVCRSKKGTKFHSKTVTENTWFEHCHTLVATCVFITYCFSVGVNFEQTIRESSVIEDQTVSTETIADRFSFCREICMISLDNEFEFEGKNGGQGKVVEIDECKIGRRKYQRGRVVEGSWILGFIERGSPENYRLEICPENKRDKDTLLQLIQKHVLVGTEIHTDCWKGYFDLEAHGYVHLTVNHSVEFVNSETGAHTQNIEFSWRAMRRFLSRGGIHKNKLDEHLCEFLWRRRIKKLGADPFAQRHKNSLSWVCTFQRSECT
ncbi:PREDICTED: uncharacterized protein LOC108777409 [Cyphomyrmex costatus]|uniref:uncharacterized protein LOC108777409 n=1 Tax=Cyphomyrmex costatus TaxID=456900 RepID=UPI0008523BE2|nr:PREDICTED: uncharacterized protein LOC108777409 [Cyphomyrmex costatus]